MRCRARLQVVVALLALLVAAGAHAQGQTGASPPLLLVISIDGLRPGWEMGSSVSGPQVSARKPGGTHGHLPDLPDLHASFFLVGPGVPAGRALGIVDMRDIAPTLAHRLGLTLPSAEGKILLR